MVRDSWIRPLLDLRNSDSDSDPDSTVVPHYSDSNSESDSTVGTRYSDTNPDPESTLKAVDTIGNYSK